MKIRFFILTLVIFILVACNPIEPNSDFVSTTKPTLESTAILRATYTKPIPAPTLNPNEIVSSIFSDLTIQTQTLYSPDGLCSWERLLAWPSTEYAVTKYGSQFFIRVSVSCVRPKIHEEVNWILVNEWQEQGFGYSIPDLLGWLADGNTLYFYDTIIPDGCQPIGGFQDNLRQVELDNGIIRSILLKLGSGISLSPDTTRLVYYDRLKAEVAIYNIANSEAQYIPFTLTEKVDDWWVGDFTWSPDGQVVLFVIIYGDPCYPTGASIQRIDLQSGDIKLLLDIDKQTFSIIEWVDLARVVITIGKEQRLLDPVSGKLYQ